MENSKSGRKVPKKPTKIIIRTKRCKRTPEGRRTNMTESMLQFEQIREKMQTNYMSTEIYQLRILKLKYGAEAAVFINRKDTVTYLIQELVGAEIENKFENFSKISKTTWYVFQVTPGSNCRITQNDLFRHQIPSAQISKLKTFSPRKPRLRKYVTSWKLPKSALYLTLKMLLDCKEGDPLGFLEL